MNDEIWARSDAVARLPVTFFRAGDQVATTSARAVQARFGGDLTACQRTISHVLCDVLDLPEQGMSSSPDGTLSLDLARYDEWLGVMGPRPESVFTTAPSLSSVTLGIGGRTWNAPDVVQVIGTDALRWAVLRSASTVSPFVLTPDLAVLASRRDANPLSLVRRAHAASVIRERAWNEDAVTRDHHQASDAGLRVSILLASRGAFDARRSRRTRPAALAVEELAAAALSHLCRAPVTRTDAPAVSVARRVLADALDAAGISAPVPY